MTSVFTDDEWEETTLVVELNGVLDAQMVRQAVAEGHVTLRRAETDRPILQIANSLYTGKWQRTVGTDIILQAEGGQLKVVSATDKMLKTEKALLTSMNNEKQNPKDHNVASQQRPSQRPTKK
uniref:TFIIIC_sub6 domain-containing protein n=1 Tax=Heterorhabditis bacteriophora TaxID=37862 RepID=A0A1I7WU01_HETBA